MAKDGFLREVDRLAREQGWRIKTLRSGHVGYWPQNGMSPVIRSGTPSDWKASAAFLAQMKRRGFVAAEQRHRSAPRFTHLTNPLEIIQEQSPGAMVLPTVKTEIQEPMNMEMEMEMENMATPTNSGATPQPPPDQSKLDFHVALRRAREAKGDSREDLARTIGVQKNTIAVWESGASPPGRVRFEQLCVLYPLLRAASPPLPHAARQTKEHICDRTIGSNDLGDLVRFIRLCRSEPWLKAFLSRASTAQVNLRELTDIVA